MSRRSNLGRVTIIPLLALAMLLASVIFSSVIHAKDVKDAKDDQPFKGVRIPYFTDNILTSIILSERASIASMEKGAEFVRMQRVTIYMYQPFYRDVEKKIPDPTRPPRLKTKIIADSGYYKRGLGRRGILEQVAHLEGNVQVFSYYYPTEGKLAGRPIIARTVTCEKATWNNATQTLSGKGRVEILERDRTITGHGFKYYMKDPDAVSDKGLTPPGQKKSPPPISPTGQKKRWGGWIVLDPPVRMLFIQVKSAAGAAPVDISTRPLGVKKNTPGLVKITSVGEAYYDLDHREVNFKTKVAVVQKQLTIFSDFLQIILDKNQGSGSSSAKEILAWGQADAIAGGEDRIGGVIIHGRPGTAKSGRTNTAFVARGLYARYLKQQETLILTDGRRTANGTELVPMVYVGLDRVSDRTIEMVYEEDTLSRLKTWGGRGVAMFLKGEDDKAKKGQPTTSGGRFDRGTTEPTSTVIRCTKEINYFNRQNRAVFTGNVRLEQTGARLAVSDILDWAGLMRKLAAGQRTGIRTPARRIWMLLPGDARQLIRKSAANAKLTPVQSARILQGLNDILWQPEFYTERYFADVVIADDARILLGQQVQNLSARQLLRLNRRLLEGAYLGKIRVCQDESDLRLNADTLIVKMTPPRSKDKPEDRRIVELAATGHVFLHEDGRTARASHAVLGELPRPPQKRNPQTPTTPTTLHYTRLTGTPRPVLAKPGEYEVQGKAITIREQAKKNPATSRAYTIMDVPGPGVVRFLPPEKIAKGIVPNPQKEELTMHRDTTEVEYKKYLIYNEELRLAHFRGSVIATADQDKITNSDQLRVWYQNVPNPVKPDSTIMQIQRIEALYNAQMHWGVREIKAHTIVRTLRPAPGSAVKDPFVTIRGQQAKPAKVWIEGGSTFTAPLIIVSKNGQLYESQGAGTMVLNDVEDNSHAVVTYSGNASYAALDNQMGRATFNRNVKMVRARMTITGDSLIADLQSKREAKDIGATEDKLPKHTLRRAVVRGIPALLKQGKGLIVIVQKGAARGGKRTARGALGVLEAHKGGDVITLSGVPNRPADVWDGKGFHLIAPRFKVQQARGLMEATGPGVVNITSIRRVQGRRPVKASNKPKDKFQVRFVREMVYNQLARKIKFFENVWIYQANIVGRGNQMTVLLEENPDFDGGIIGQDVDVKAIEAEGNVRFWRYPTLTEDMKRIPNLRPEHREGKTLLTRSRNAYYDIIKGTIRLWGSPPRVAALQQQVTYDPKTGVRKISRERVFAKQITAKVNGDVVTPRAKKPEVKFLPGTGPLKFDDE